MGISHRTGADLGPLQARPVTLILLIPASQSWEHLGCRPDRKVDGDVWQQGSFTLQRRDKKMRLTLPTSLAPFGLLLRSRDLYAGAPKTDFR